MANTVKTKSAAVRAKLTHPVVDADAHIQEILPVVVEYMRDVGGQKVADRYNASLPAGAQGTFTGLDRIGGAKGWHGLTAQQRRDMRVLRPQFWTLSTRRSISATVMLPNLYRDSSTISASTSRFYILGGLPFLRKSRRGNSRSDVARSTMFAELYGPHADRADRSGGDSHAYSG